MREKTVAVDPMERAIGLTIQDLAKEQGITHKEIQERAGIQDKTFRRHYTEFARPIPMQEFARVAAALGKAQSEIVRLAEERLARSGK